MLSLCAERSRADGFDQIDGLGAGDERSRFAVHGGKAILAVIAVERQRERREILVIQMQRQRNLFLSVSLFVRETGGDQGGRLSLRPLHRPWKSGERRERGQ